MTHLLVERAARGQLPAWAALGEKGRRIRELTSAVQKRCALKAAAPAWEPSLCTVWSLGGRAWAARLLSPRVHGEVCRSRCERSLTVEPIWSKTTVS